jgi:transposase
VKISLQAEKIYIASQAIDFRVGVDGLCALVQEDLQQSPNSGIYLFYNKSFNKIKLLGWHGNGFVMIYKRLEHGKFFVRTNGSNLQINSEQLNWLLIGVDWRLLTHQEGSFNAYF